MSSAAPSFPSTKQVNNYERLCRLLVDVGWQVLRGTFDRVRPPGSLHSVLADSKIHTQLKSLQKKRVLSTPQWRKLYPVIKSSVSSRDFDSTLLVILLRNICDLFPPATGWSNCPLVTDTTLAADIARIQFYRNTVYSHASNASVDDAAFSSYWKEIKDTLVRLGGACYGDAIDNFKNEIMGLEFEGHYQELLKQWVEGDNSIEDKLEEDDRDKKQRKLNDSEESSEDSKRSTEIDETETESLECPPQLSVKIPKKSELPPNSRPWSTVELPIDILLMTVEDDEFLSCFSYLEKPFKSYHSSIGPVYFGSIGNEHGKKRKIGLMKCSKGSADPGSSLPAVQNAVRVLRPRAVFSVGACSGLNCKKTRLGDVVVSAKLITPSYKTPPGRGIGNLRRHISDGWKPPLEKPDHRDVEVHCDGVVLSIQKSDGGWPYEEIIQRYPEATAVEMEGGGVFAAAHDLKTEWVVVKGIKDYADGSQSSSVEWGTFASVMAASVVANILSDAVIFEDWPHYNPDANGSQTPAVSAYTEALKASAKSQTEFLPKLMASATISNVRTDDIFTNVLIQHGRKALNKEVMGATRSEKLHYFGKVSGTPVKHCEEIFIGATNEERGPKRILLIGKAGIGKTLFCQNFVRDWADDKLFHLQSPFTFVYLLTFRQLNLLGNDQLSLQELLNYSTVLDNSSIIDGSLFEFIVNHPEEVLIIIDGYDEYSQQNYIAGKSEEQYHNKTEKKMPVAALCTKLIKGKLLRDSVVMITSRPDESDKMGGIHFDRYVEIAGFSPEQVQEFIKKYFRENDTMKNTVLDHVMKNENLVTFAHIPILCFLMCFSMEDALQASKSADDLPVSTTDIYSKVVNIFELKHNAFSEFKTEDIPEKFKGSLLVENTLDILSEFGAQLLLQNKPIFEERDMEEKFRSEEIEKLKGSGLLHCGPPFRKSLLETTKYLSFTHLTLHEFLAARWFVMTNVIPKGVSGMVLQFVAGILSKKKNDELMEKLLQSIPFSSDSDYLLLKAKCLSEYQDKEFAKNTIKKHPNEYPEKSRDPKTGGLRLESLDDVDCIAISFLLDVFTALHEEEATTAQHQRSINCLVISNSYLTRCGIKRIGKSLEKERCPVTELVFRHVRLTDDCFSGLACCKFRLTQLCIMKSSITDTGVTILCDALKYPSRKVATLNLRDNLITDTGVISLCDALKHPSCEVTKLNLRGNKITDTGVTSLRDALIHPSCKVISLNLRGNKITDAGVDNLCDSLTHPSCKVTTLSLSYNRITSTCAIILYRALVHQSCKVTTLDLSGNEIHNIAVSVLCDALNHPSCKVTTLRLTGTRITDTGATSLCDAAKHPSCKVATLDLSYNQITDTCITSLRKPVQHHNCKHVELYVITKNREESMKSKRSLRSLETMHRPFLIILI